MSFTDKLFEPEEAKKIKELRLARLCNLSRIRADMELTVYRIQKKKQLEELGQRVSATTLRSKILEILDLSYRDLKDKIEKDLPIDQEDLDFAVKLKQIKSPVQPANVN